MIMQMTFEVKSLEVPDEKFSLSGAKVDLKYEISGDELPKLIEYGKEGMELVKEIVTTLE